MIAQIAFDAMGGEVLVFILICGAAVWGALIISIARELATRHDIGGSGKGIWVLIILLFPVLGVLAYMIVGRPTKPEIEFYAAETRESMVDLAIAADELERAHEQLEAGEITQAEFDALKLRVASDA